MEKRRNCSLGSLGAISPLFHNIFNISLASRVQLLIYLLNVVVQIIFFLNSATLICRGTDISKYFRESLGIRDNESRLYIWNNLVVWGRPRWLSWMRRPTGDQEVTGSTPAEVGNILSWRSIMKYFLWSFSPFRWFKKGSCQFLAKECAQYWLTT